ncbi:NAD(P)H-dependent oxidoreductase [Teredinibacter purpureus]|uniref:NAD(P)H-dependent oxidoreductase n=1 Tax=Teredinibacter purpureus TaxID=2731756 RepID=UPI0005F8386D|nr:NAD(P)H-dependent oxidoreductase [Teredinibacter purpureus]
MNVVVINANPKKNSFCHGLASAYADGARNRGDDVTVITLSDLQYDPVLRTGFDKDDILEPDLKTVEDAIAWADHIVFVYPNWWGVMPAILKGTLDRVLKPGFAFKFENGGVIPLLRGKTASLFITMDVPIWVYRFIHHNRGAKLMRDNVLKFCGIKTRKIKYFGPIHSSSEKKRESWLGTARALALTA